MSERTATPRAMQRTFRDSRLCPLGLPVVVLSTLVLSTTFATAQARNGRVDYNRDVQPILTQNCSICHGLDTNRRRAGLRLDNAESAFAKLPSGRTAIVPGDLKASELVERITAHDASQMPPAASGKKLTNAQIETL